MENQMSNTFSLYAIGWILWFISGAAYVIFENALLTIIVGGIATLFIMFDARRKYLQGDWNRSNSIEIGFLEILFLAVILFFTVFP
jgi:hypothetical protein